MTKKEVKRLGSLEDLNLFREGDIIEVNFWDYQGNAVIFKDAWNRPHVIRWQNPKETYVNRGVMRYELENFQGDFISDMCIKNGVLYVEKNGRKVNPFGGFDGLVEENKCKSLLGALSIKMAEEEK